MGQHFLLSAAARTLSVAKVARMGEEEAWNLFRAIRWSETDGEPYCPDCGSLATYRHKSRKIFSCQACGRQFSVTSGTIFASRKMAIRDLLVAIAIFVNGVKGHSALQLSRDLDCQYKTAFVLAHKLREALGAETKERQATGTVEIDGAYFGGYVKPSNYVENRRDRRLARNQTGKRQVVAVMRERGGRTLPFVVPKESLSVPIMEKRIRLDSIIHADEAYGWDPLHLFYEVKRINHQEAYSHDGASTNQAESFFSRIRRAEIGMHHHIAGPYLESYALEMAWREDTRQINNGEQFLLMILASLSHPVSRVWKGYWERRKVSSPGQEAPA
ncbi:IS1595 family transposase [Devosia sp. RR2S18]|uniref:IS1595 family transposase n=1 Tax=Devosia rhizosphaerae TaxID=3049774 RepID=UPI00253F746F|nr:IS1595 family transposase [Devosia sp. RR2S18]WIJ24815.1 IS1595 family transposase [Devosia sp. RR2S18]WIJ24837.1 IS1595 family transposase [Devosia sp. RR2S18]